MSGVREDILASAIKFLQDPKVQASSLGKKVAFLESKGLTQQEIEEAMARANGTSTGAAGTVAMAAPSVPTQYTAVAHPGQGQVMMAPPPLPPKYDWKDMFIAAVVAGGFSYGMWQIAKRVVGPKLQWPSQEELELDKKKLDEQFEEIEKSLAEVKESTTVVAKNVEDQTAHVKESLEGMTGVLDGMKNNDDKREQELVGLKTDIENITTMIPKLMEKNKESQTNTMNELQTEIKSLKSLLLNRRATPGAPSTSGPSPASWNTPSYASAVGSPSHNNTATAAVSKSDDPAMSFLSTKASIPAWQLAAQKVTPAQTTAENPPAESSESTTA
ncbi:peroxisomal membrane protein pex14 [Mortierella polycephala]|uniref:Peroxisomal membrane protein PEX14 n=1 Tax=Mortierella polycephala TaxID=41804 RepID=A0A9P6QF03_9FUNG|nr:peroxisomal membrane protein pex14 [Mortierella polycephala]